MPNPPKPPAPKTTAPVQPSVNINIVQSGKPAKTVSVKPGCCLSKKGATK